MTERNQRAKFTTLLLLARASNLPTVWSNCLAGWILGGGGNDWQKFFLLSVGASLLYIGGMFLNDAFDAEFDRQFRKERPIPSGAISEKEVWLWSFVSLGLGAATLVSFGKHTALFTSLLISGIVLYDAVHKKTILSPLLMAVCRLLLYLVAATAAQGVNGFVLWHALALAGYIVGLSYIAKTESAPGPVRYWPCVLLAGPLGLAYLVNDGAFRQQNFIFLAIVLGWSLWSLRPLLWSASRNVGATVSGLLAGIVWVDLLAVGGESSHSILILAGFFVLARLFQKFIPAT